MILDDPWARDRGARIRNQPRIVLQNPVAHEAPRARLVIHGPPTVEGPVEHCLSGGGWQLVWAQGELLVGLQSFKLLVRPCHWPMCMGVFDLHDACEVPADTENPVSSTVDQRVDAAVQMRSEPI